MNLPVVRSSSKSNNTDESNDDTDAESEEEDGKLLNEDKGDGQVED